MKNGFNMKTLNQYMDERLKNDEFRKEWENSQPELDVIRAIVDGMDMMLELKFVPKPKLK